MPRPAATRPMATCSTASPTRCPASWRPTRCWPGSGAAASRPTPSSLDAVARARADLAAAEERVRAALRRPRRRGAATGRRSVQAATAGRDGGRTVDLRPATGLARRSLASDPLRSGTAITTRPGHRGRTIHMSHTTSLAAPPPHSAPPPSSASSWRPPPWRAGPGPRRRCRGDHRQRSSTYGLDRDQREGIWRTRHRSSAVTASTAAGARAYTSGIDRERQLGGFTYSTEVSTLPQEPTAERAQPTRRRSARTTPSSTSRSAPASSPGSSWPERRRRRLTPEPPRSHAGVTGIRTAPPGTGTPQGVPVLGRVAAVRPGSAVAIRPAPLVCSGARPSPPASSSSVARCSTPSCAPRGPGARDEQPGHGLVDRRGRRSQHRREPRAARQPDRAPGRRRRRPGG